MDVKGKRDFARFEFKLYFGRILYIHYTDVIIKENIKASRHWPLCGEFTGTGEFPAQRASYAENVSI